MKIKAFTLVELLMVVCLIGVMAIFAVPNYTKAVSKSYEKSASNDLLIIYSAQKLIYNGGGSYLACANTAAINTNLSLSVLANGFNYSCSLPTASTFNCKAIRTDNSFGVALTDSNSTVCCCPTYTCPSIGTACASCP